MQSLYIKSKRFNTKNDTLYSKEELQTIFSNDKLEMVNDDFFISNVAIDSRNVRNNGIFFAIKGENNDGHNFIQNAIDNGSVCIICEYIPKSIKEDNIKKNISFIVVKNTIDALTKLAIYNRNRIKAKVIAITGNVGKTTTRCLIADTLSHFLKTASPVRNYNNHIGLPYTIAHTPLNTEILVLEMGMNHLGEIEHLTKIAHPDVAIITTISPVHMEFMSNIDTIIQAKAEIFKGLTKNGIAMLNYENQYYEKLCEYAKQEGIRNIVKIGKKAGLKYNYITTPSNVNAILSKYNLKNKKTYRLTSCHEKRSISKVLINLNGVNISYYNTHFSYQDDCPKVHMEKVIEIIKKDHNPIIISGDFNKVSNEIYKNYLEPLGFIVAANDTKYHNKKGSNSYMDSIFILPNNHIEVVDSKTIATYRKYSDHNLVIATMFTK